MIIQSHPTGNANVRQTALALCEAELMAEFWTCTSWNPDSLIARLLPSRLQKQLARRTFAPQIRAKTHTFPWREMMRLAAPKLKLQAFTMHETGFFSVDAVYRSLDERVARRLEHLDGIRGVWAPEDGALESFRAAKKRGIKCLYDLPIGYWKAGHQIFREEIERQPQWAQTLTGMADSAKKLARKDEEIRLADAIFVASSFTRETLRTFGDLTIPTFLVPYGAPAAMETAPISKSASEPLRILFVGSLSQRKGLSYLLEAVEKLGKHAQLTLIGQKTGGECVPLDAALARHRYIPSLPHGEILHEMREHDVLVFPSLFEGFGLVIPEAMSQGLPVITTSHTGGPDIICDGEDGFIVPVRDADAIFQRLESLLEPQLLLDMKIAAWKKAQQLSWATYRNSQASAVKQVLA